MALALLVLGTAPPAAADPAACRREVARASEKFARAKMKTLQKCEDAVVAGKAAGPCPDAKAATKIAKASAKLEGAIAKRCGGADRTCGTADDESLAAIGWDVGSCLNLSGGGCTGAIGHCGDVAACVLCVDEAGVDQSIDLYYDAFTTGGGAAVTRCQRAIGKETTKFFEAERKARGKCLSAALATGAGRCPDAKAEAAIAKAETKKVAKICRACGGADQVCGGGDDLTPAAIGFVATCPAVDPPGASAPCGGAVGTLAELVACVDCVTSFTAACTSAAGAPAAGSYPAECNGGAPAPTATPTATAADPATPTPTATPAGSCGNGTVDPGETCDGSDDAACPGLCQADCECGAPCTLPDPMPATLALAARPGIDLDTGWTGISHDLPGVDDAPTTSARLSGCDTDLGSPTCGQCTVSGPIAYQGPANTCRCFDPAAPDASSLASCDPDPTAPAIRSAATAPRISRRSNATAAIRASAPAPAIPIARARRSAGTACARARRAATAPTRPRAPASAAATAPARRSARSRSRPRRARISTPAGPAPHTTSPCRPAPPSRASSAAAIRRSATPSARSSPTSARIAPEIRRSPAPTTRRAWRPARGRAWSTATARRCRSRRAACRSAS